MLSSVGKRNVFSDVDFSEANLSGTGHTSARILPLPLHKYEVERRSTSKEAFSTDCIFEGELDEVLFYDLGFNAKGSQPKRTPLEELDFGKAKFRHVEFRHLDLDTVRLPVSDRSHRLKRRLSPELWNAFLHP